MEGEVNITREQLRTLVVAFFPEDARRPLLIKLQGTVLRVIGISCSNQLASDAGKRYRGFAPVVSTGKFAAPMRRRLLGTFGFPTLFQHGRPARRGNELLQGVICSGHVFAQGGPRSDSEVDPREPGADPRLPQTVRLVCHEKARQTMPNCCASTSRHLSWGK
jgi:hypothetical protein